jgi:hypothetical protein
LATKAIPAIRDSSPVMGVIMDIDRKRIAAVRALETLRFTYSGGEWFPPAGAASADAGLETDGRRHVLQVGRCCAARIRQPADRVGHCGGEAAYRRVQQMDQAALESRINDLRKALYH